MGPEDDKGENHTAGIPNKIPNFSTITVRPPSLLKKQSSFLHIPKTHTKYIYRKTHPKKKKTARNGRPS